MIQSTDLYCSTKTILLISPSSKPTSHLRCGQMEVRAGVANKCYNVIFNTQLAKYRKIVLNKNTRCLKGLA